MESLCHLVAERLFKQILQMMIAETLLIDGRRIEQFTCWYMFRDAPICWMGTLIMAGCFVGCIVWSLRLRRQGLLTRNFPLPFLLALVPLALGVTSSFLLRNCCHALRGGPFLRS
jgi:hypothetical protein